MAHMIEKWSEEGKGTEKWHRIRVVAKGKMSLSRVAISLYTSKIERMKCEGKSIVRCSNKESKNRAQGFVIVIVREGVQDKSYHHVYESRTFSKGLTWCKLTITPICGTLIESGNHLVFGHSPQTLITGIVRMLYPWNMKYIRNKLRCDYNARTSNASRKERY